MTKNELLSLELLEGLREAEDLETVKYTLLSVTVDKPRVRNILTAAFQIVESERPKQITTRGGVI